MIDSKIEFCDNTLAFWRGCERVSEGCKACWMHRTYANKPIDSTIVTLSSERTFYAPFSWKTPRKIFVCHTSDFFIKDADKWRDEAWYVMKSCPQHTFQIITKRADRILDCLPDDWGEGYPNVWIGVTVENMKNFNRADILSKIPAKVRFIIAEPLLEEIDFLTEINGNRVIDKIDWVILGGESGYESGPYKYRPSELIWYENAIKQLRNNTKAAIFVKQLGAHLRNQLGLKEWFGANMNEWPEHLQIREFPV